MRSLLRRRIDDPVPADLNDDATQFTDVELNEILNSAAIEVQAEIKRHDPTAFVRVTRSNINANEDLIPKPEGQWGLIQIRKLDAATGRYVALKDPVTLEQLDLITNSQEMRYAHAGRFIKVAPIPEVGVGDGLEWWFVEGAELPTSAGGDTLRYPISTGLDQAIIIKAQILLTPEFVENSPTAVLDKLYLEQIAKIPLYYQRTYGREVPFTLGISKVGQQ